MTAENQTQEKVKLSFWKRIKKFFRTIWQKIQPGPTAKKRATMGVMITLIIILTIASIFSKFGFGSTWDPLIGLGLSLVIAALGGLIVIIVTKLVILLPRFLGYWGLFFGGGLCIYLSLIIHSGAGMLFGLILLFVESIFSAALFSLISKEFKTYKSLKKGVTLLIILLGIFFHIYLISWLTSPGDDQHLIQYQKDQLQIMPLNLPDPSQTGSFKVAECDYGSSNDTYRNEFGQRATIKTDPVDASAFVKNNKGLKMKLRKMVLGYTTKEFPVNGHVWYPTAPGSFPLVLMVHGNHNLAEVSDPGYAYLGRLLASRGFIAVSVDENFFNGSMFGGLSRENDGRAWMLLQHLKVWQQWQQTPEHPFFGKVNMDKIALIGHSRGGESAAIAGLFNRLKRYPDDATISFDFNFNIKAIVAIAPCDGQYSPAGKPNSLENVNYLVLQGAHDSDVAAFMGMRQFNRVKFFPDSPFFKASVYSYRSNHGQFNTVWGNTDFGWPLSLFINKKPLLSGKEQRQIAKIYISAFLETTLKDKRAYIPLFRDHRKIRQWLPQDYLITRFQDSSFKPICTFDEDVDVCTGTSTGSVLFGKNLKVWREEDLAFRGWSTHKDNVLVLGWQKDIKKVKKDENKSSDANESAELSNEIASYTIKLNNHVATDKLAKEDPLLVFSIANSEEKLPQKENKESKEKEPIPQPNVSQVDKASEQEQEEKETGNDKKKEKESLDFSIELVDSSGQSAKLPLSHFVSVPPVLKSKFLKLNSANKRYGKKYEITLQTVELPLVAFVQTNPNFLLHSLTEIRFVFDRSSKGIIILDHIGFAKK